MICKMNNTNNKILIKKNQTIHAEQRRIPLEVEKKLFTQLEWLRYLCITWCWNFTRSLFPAISHFGINKFCSRFYFARAIKLEVCEFSMKKVPLICFDDWLDK